LSACAGVGGDALRTKRTARNAAVAAARNRIPATISSDSQSEMVSLSPAASAAKAKLIA
jgi:hypothetical protein